MDYLNTAGLYVPQLESDACGIGMLAHLENIQSHGIISDALTMLENMEHRGACGCDPDSGDGAGILIQLPDSYFRKLDLKFSLPPKGKYAVGCVFLPKDKHHAEVALCMQESAEKLSLKILGTRKVPVNNNVLGVSSSESEPDIIHLFMAPIEDITREALERKLLVFRKHITHEVIKKLPELKDDFYIASLSSQTLVYKGQLNSRQVRKYYIDLQQPDLKSAIALVHSRFSTNTVPLWRLAQPFRMIAHNGEINTIEGNKNWWITKEKVMKSDVFTDEELALLMPIFNETSSDSAIFDNVAEFLVLAGRSLPHVMMMMIPEAWQNADHMEDYKKEFYEYHDGLMEPWDGPASMCFTNGVVVGGTLDRNGLRPSRYYITTDNRLILASETGVLHINPELIAHKGRLEPGKILIADLEEQSIVGDEDLKKIICNRLPYKSWLGESKIDISELSARLPDAPAPNLSLLQRQTANGFTREDEELIIEAMVETHKEAVGSMGSDTPLAVLSRHAQHISTYFRQQFAQVTNPPIDSLRESEYMTLKTILGGTSNILDRKNNTLHFIRLNSPILSERDYFKLLGIQHDYFQAGVLTSYFTKHTDTKGLEEAIDMLCRQALDRVREGSNLLFIDNSVIDKSSLPVPSLMACGAIHHFLVEKGVRHRVSLIINGADIWETHHIACLLSYGADAVYPSLAYETIRNLSEAGRFKDIDNSVKAITSYIRAADQGLLKIMSKLGISTVASYKGAQTFEALGIAAEVISKCFKGTVSRIGGMTFEMLAKEALVKHTIAVDDKHLASLIDLGVYQWKQRGEYHLFNPQSIHLLQYATKKNDYDIFKKFTQAINDQEKSACTLRSLLDFKKGKAIPLAEVESVERIMKRFATGAMSFGSISHEAHTTLAKAMNRIGAKSNSGEGGEDESRYTPLADGDSERSAIKQVASGRFGVTIHYLSNAEELQIKMAQGAKPGEGGQLPGHKVDEWIARVRHSTPGVGLISPPPHHDIYSIEDLAQLIFDLKNANREARISVKLVSKAGVGIIASGVAKGKADHILISGHDGGTGASPLSSIRYAGLPWELGLAETHQTLIKNRIRNRVTIQADGQMRTGRDMAIACMLGAEEWGVATAALVVEGCILMRKCHLNTCPVGIATQDPDLRKKFDGKVEDVVNFFHFLARDLREIMAELGFRTVDEMVGRCDMLITNNQEAHWKAASLNLAPLLYRDPLADIQDNYCTTTQDHELDDVLDRELIEYANLALEDKITINSEFPVVSTNRAVGTMLSNEIAKKYGSAGLPEDSINFRFRGSAGQSFGAFGAAGLTFTLEGDANDYFGKGLSGAKLIIIPDRDSKIIPQDNIIIGNVALYGATSGQAYIKGKAGERFAVRNSGASTVVEGLGAHGCEYMTGGRVVILGGIGRNFAAGMSGGIAYIYDPEEKYSININTEMVLIEELDDAAKAELRKLVRDHFTYTASLVALDILQNWWIAKDKFIKVIPREYKKVLQRLSQSDLSQVINQ